MKTILKLALIFASMATIAFPPGYATKKIKNDPDAISTGTVVEVLSAGNYTYVKVKENKENKWIATSPTKILKGDKVEFLKGPAMKDFYSKALKKNFKTIHFTSYVKVTKRTMKEKSDVVAGTIKKANYKIADIFKDSKKLENKEVLIRAKVVKSLSGIMKKNWLHIQDGTNHKGKFDLVVTTLDKVKEGETVLIKAKVSLNKDFGHGYVYPIILENASVSK